MKKSGNISHLRRWADAVLRWVYVPACLLCGDHRMARGAAVCAPCWHDLAAASRQPGSRRLARSLRSPHIEQFYAVLPFDARVQQIVHELKYRQRPGVAAEIVHHIGSRVQDLLRRCEIDILAPVPLHRRRLRQRGYNQSELLAREIGVILNRPVRVDLAKRRRNTPSQTRLSAAARKENVRHAFASDPAVGAADKTILLVDDLVTTGATLNACAAAIRAAAPCRILALAIARA